MSFLPIYSHICFNINRDAHGVDLERVWSDPDRKGLKFSDPDPSDLMGLGFLMGLNKLFNLSHLII